MANVHVWNWKKEKVGESTCPPSVFEQPVPAAPRLDVVKAYLAGQRRGHAQDQDALRGLRLGQEALQAEGNRPRAAGRRTPADSPPRRHGLRAACRAPTRRRCRSTRRRTRCGPSSRSRLRRSRAHGPRPARRSTPPKTKELVDGRSASSASRARRSSWTRATTRTSRAPRGTSEASKLVRSARRELPTTCWPRRPRAHRSEALARVIENAGRPSMNAAPG